MFACENNLVMALRAPAGWLKLRNLIPATERADLLLEKFKIPDVPEIPHAPLTSKDPALSRIRSRDLRPHMHDSARAHALPSTAGISWDELDAEFIKFLDEREQRAHSWSEYSDENWLKAETEAKTGSPTGRRKESIKLMTRWSKQYMRGLGHRNLFEHLNEVISDRRIQREMQENF